MNQFEDSISRRRFIRAAAGVGLGLVGISVAGCIEREEMVQNGGVTMLPNPRLKGDISLEEAIKGRRSERSFKDIALTKEQLSQLLWSAQGITDPDPGRRFFRAAPSAGAQYPLDIYVVVGGVEELGVGVYHYDPHEHSTRLLVEGDLREPLARACVAQMFMADAPISIVITAEYGRITDRYGDRGVRYAHMEVGHVGQNIHLQAEALGLGTVVIGAFMDDEVAELLHLPRGHEPLYVMPVGYL